MADLRSGHVHAEERGLRVGPLLPGLAETWLQENAEAIEAYNTHVEANGVFNDGIRSF